MPGTSWGDEAPWIARLASTIAAGRPSVTVLLNGGEIAWTDAAESVAAGGPCSPSPAPGAPPTSSPRPRSGGPARRARRALVGTGLVEAVALGEDARPSLQERVEAILRAERPDDGR